MALSNLSMTWYSALADAVIASQQLSPGATVSNLPTGAGDMLLLGIVATLAAAFADGICWLSFVGRNCWCNVVCFRAPV